MPVEFWYRKLLAGQLFGMLCHTLDNRLDDLPAFVFARGPVDNQIANEPVELDLLQVSDFCLERFFFQTLIDALQRRKLR